MIGWSARHSAMATSIISMRPASCPRRTSSGPSSASRFWTNWRPAIPPQPRNMKFRCGSISPAISPCAFITYSLLQWYLLRTERKQLNPKTPTRILDLLRPVFSVIVIYYQNYVAFLDPLEYQEMVLTLSEPARKKILAKTRKLRRGLAHQLQNPRAP